jgi:hypothetical protein
LIRIALSARAYCDIKATLPAGSVVYPPERNGRGEYLLWLSEAEANRLAALRQAECFWPLKTAFSPPSLIGKNCVSKVCHYVQALIDPIKQIAHISRGLLVDSHLHEASHPILKEKHLGSKRRERLSGRRISLNREVLHRRERIRRARGWVNSTKLPVVAKRDHLPQTGPLLEIDLGDYTHCLLSNFGCVDALFGFPCPPSSNVLARK